VHGTPDIAGLSFIQDGIPFDASGKLHAVALGRSDFKDAKPKVTRITEAKKKAHLDALKAGDLNAPNIEPEVKPEDPDAHVNLRQWAMGEVKYMPHVLYRVAQKRSGKTFNNTADIKAWLVEAKVVAPSELVK
jgi:hypothetical protein